VVDVSVNIHHHREMVVEFLSRKIFRPWVRVILEDELSGTAGTIRDNATHFRGCTTLVAHADNWSHCDLTAFIDFHFNQRPENVVISMMTFRTSSPQDCGIVEVDASGVVQKFYEKHVSPPGNLANGAVYILESEVIEWITMNPGVRDFSNDVVPRFLGRIAAWENSAIHRDIGFTEALLQSQKDPPMSTCWPIDIDDWYTDYSQHPIHKSISDLR